MSQMTDEALSALLDGECSPVELDRVLEAMERDPALKARYSRMCLARDTLRSGSAKPVPASFAAGVLAALDQQPASTVVPFRARRLAGLDWVRLWQPMAGLAAAATLAAVAVLVLRPESALVPESQDVAGASSAQVPAAKDDRHWTELDAANARQLNDYLTAYNRSRAEQGVAGTLNHARYEAHPAGTAPATTAQPEEPLR